MSNKKNIILFAIIVVLIIIIFIIMLLIQSKKNIINNTTTIDDDGNINESNLTINYEIEKVKDATKFYTVSDCMQKYFDAISKKSKKDLYNMLDKEYSSNNNIETNTISEKNILFEIDDDIYIEKMYYIDGTNKQQYSVEVINKDKKMFFKVNLDTANFTFSIEPINNSDYNSLEEIKLTNGINSIEENESNVFEYSRYTEEDVIYMYYNYYNSLLDAKVDKAYELLDEEYKNKRFTDKNDFIDYANKTKKIRESAAVYKYYIEDELGYNKYIIVDTNNRYYIIKEYYTMNFTIQLDNYTIKPDNYVEEYNKLSEDKKLSNNINLFIDMVNNKDYNGIYNTLDETFKKNKFRNFSEFTKFIDKEFFDYNIIEPESANNEGNIFIYKVKIKSGNTVNALERDLTIIMKLTEDTKYTMSFSFS